MSFSRMFRNGLIPSPITWSNKVQTTKKFSLNVSRQFFIPRLTYLTENNLQFRRNNATNAYVNPGAYKFSKHTKPDRTIVKRIVLTLFPIITFGLGTWQVQRLRWKVALIENYEERLSKPTVVLPKKIKMDALDDFLFRRVKTLGRFRHDQEMLLGPRSLDNKHGYYVITPLERENGTTVLVKRGWISKDKIDSITRKNEKGDTVAVEGLLKTSDKKTWFTPKNKPEKNQWLWADVETMAERTNAQPVLIEQIFEGSPYLTNQMIQDGTPVGKTPSVELRNTHLQYAITWYSLSVATSAMLYFLFKKSPKEHVRHTRR